MRTNRADRNDHDRCAERRQLREDMEALVEAKAEDGTLSAEDIASFVNEIDGTTDPRARRRKARALRRAIRRSDELTRDEKKEAVRALERALRAADSPGVPPTVDDGVDTTARLIEAKRANELIEPGAARGDLEPPAPQILGARPIGFGGF
jgi:hypothetical protein